MPPPRPVQLLTPSVRARHPFPRMAPVALGLAVLVAMVTMWIGADFLAPVRLTAKIAAVIAAAVVAMWAEDRLFTSLVGRASWQRVVGSVVAPLAVAVLLLPVVLLVGLPFALLKDDATTMTAMLLGGLWFCSASLGSMLVVVIDVAISAVVFDFRTRVQLAVLGLLTACSGLAVLLYRLGRSLAEHVATMSASEMPSGLSIDLGEGKLSPTEAERVLRLSETPLVVAAAFFIVMAVVTLPAVLSATGKIAESVMERLHPLAAGFRHVAEGDLTVRVEEGGSRDFVRISQGFNRMAEALDARTRELQETHRATRRFVPFEFLNVLGRASIRDVRRGDHEALEMTVMFADIRGFTPLAEALGAEGTFRFINRYVEVMEPAIHPQRGFINDFFGDGIMALFNRSADDALRAAIAMLRALDSFNEELAAEQRPAIRIGIGVHTGHLMLGTIGGKDRLDCTVIGDPANLASRVEGMTKIYGVPMLTTESTIARLEHPEAFRFREIDRVRAKGKQEPITIYEVMDDSPASVEKLRDDVLGAFVAGLRAYREGEFDSASAHFGVCVQACPDDAVAVLYVQRCAAMQQEGAASDWAGVTELRHK